MFISTPSIQAALAAIAASGALEVIPPTCTRVGTVTPGDVTCDIFSARNHVSTFQLQYANPPAVDCHFLQPGTYLCLGLGGTDCVQTDIVRPGDTCNAIAGRNQIPNLNILYNNNPNIDGNCGNIYPGEVLCVANHAFPYGGRLD